ncbi:MAG: LysR family transcriptional regulator [Rhodopila sp.]|nr:LysR family transcriptional regulator [Rhodopila sp.]
MRFFVRSADLGSFSRAAVLERTTVAAVSRHVSRLEAHLGTTLLDRSTRHIHLTEAGSLFYEHSVTILREVDMARRATASLNERPQGLLRINVPAAFGRRHIVPHLQEFLASYPEIRVDATLTDSMIDLIEAGADVAVRITATAGPALAGRRLAPHRRIAVASPAYLAQRPPLKRPEDLSQHECLHHAVARNRAWYFRLHADPNAEPVSIQPAGQLCMTDTEALVTALRAGLGVALLAVWLVSDDIRSGRLVPVLPEWDALISLGPQRAIWGVYPSKRIAPTKVDTFLTFLAERFGDPPYWEL